MGFMANLKKDGASGCKAIKAKYSKTVLATDDDVGTVEVKIRLNTVVLDTSPVAICGEAKYGGSVKVGDNNVTYKSGDADAEFRLTGRLSEILAASEGISAEDAEALEAEYGTEADKRAKAEAATKVKADKAAAKAAKAEADARLKASTTEPSKNGTS